MRRASACLALWAPDLGGVIDGFRQGGRLDLLFLDDAGGVTRSVTRSTHAVGSIGAMLLTDPNTSREQQPAAALNRKGMVWVPGGTYWMGSDNHYPEERPAHRVSVDGFWMDAHPVTVGEFRRFVKDTGYLTTAELQPAAEDFPDADPALLVPGSMVFTPPDRPVPLDDYRRWWSYVPHATWRQPEGPGSDVGTRNRHPVTHISYFDACAYAAWAGKSLPTEAEWEFAARGGLDRVTYVWGDEREPKGRPGGNVWQGMFPWENLLEDGYAGTSPVGRYRANGYGLFDMAGNVWEWTCDHHTASHADSGKNLTPASNCCVPRNPVQEASDENRGRREAGTDLPERYTRRTVKGGSHLCSPNYCDRYRPAARQGHTEDASTGHIGFRCIVRTAEVTR